MLEAATEEAQQVLLDQTVFALDAKRVARFVVLLDAPENLNSAWHRPILPGISGFRALTFARATAAVSIRRFP